MHALSLFELNEFIRQVLALNLPEALWVRCELAQVKESRGHFYLDLVQKAEASDEIIAQGQAVLWNREFRSLRKKVGAELDGLLREGIEVLFKARVEFSERYGLKLAIEEMDPAYTLGRLEMKRLESLQRLQKLGLLEKNKALRLPPVLQRIAVLTSEQAAGCQDFLKQLSGNSFGYCFRLQIFPVAVQGNFAEPEMLTQFMHLARQSAQFDAAVVIRGGGAKLDLAAFDSFELCRAAACLSLPLLTGIGHDVDETLLDCVAHTSLKTPTAVADFILHRNLQFETEMENLALAVKTRSESKRRDAALRLQHFSQVLDFQTKNLLQRQAMMLDYLKKEVPAALKNCLAKHRLQLEVLEKTTHLLSPETALRRGFSITFKNGKALTTASEASPGDEIETVFRDGKLRSVVKELP